MDYERTITRYETNGQLNRKRAQLQAEAVFSFYRKTCSDEPEFAQQVDALINVSDILGMERKKFAVKLFTTPLSKRYDVLDKMVTDRLDKGTLKPSDEATLVNVMDVLYGKVKK